MKLSLYYTIITVLNLIAFAVVTACLPASVPLHVSHGVVEQVGSPWVFLALPAVSALLSLGVFLTLLSNGKRKIVVCSVIVALGGIFLSLGWMFMAIAVQPAAFGEKIFFPYATVSALPLSLLLMGGCLLFKNRRDKLVVLSAGFFSAACAVVFSCIVVVRVDYVALIVLCLALIASCALLFLRKRSRV